MSRAFSSRSNCNVPSVEAIDGSLVSSCKVDAVPITDFCFPFQTPTDVPPSFNFGCYPIKVKGGVAGTEHCVRTISLSFQIKDGPIPSHIAGNLFAAIGSEGLSSLFNGCGTAEPRAEMKVEYPNSGETGFCEPEITFDIGIPCVPISLQSDRADMVAFPEPPSMFVRGGKKMSLTSSGLSVECNYQFDLGFQVPCPVFFSDEEEQTVTMNEEKELKIDIIQDEEALPDACVYDVTADLKIPCPEMTVGDESISMNAGPELAVDIVDNSDADNCKYEFDFNLRIPCPSMSVSKESISLNIGPFVDLEITPVSDASKCQYEFGIDIGVPCPSIHVNTQLDCGQTSPYFGGNVYTDHSAAACNYTLSLSLGLGKTSTITFVADASLVGSSLAKTMGSMVFNCGILGG